MSTEEFSYKCPYLQLPKILRYLSFEDDNGNMKPLSANHILYLIYCSELDQSYKRLSVQVRELGFTRTTIIKLRKDLERPMTEIGVPLIRTTEFRDTKKKKRLLIESFPHQEEMGAYFDKLYDKETGKECRDHWIDVRNSWSEKTGLMNRPDSGLVNRPDDGPDFSLKNKGENETPTHNTLNKTKKKKDILSEIGISDDTYSVSQKKKASQTKISTESLTLAKLFHSTIISWKGKLSKSTRPEKWAIDIDKLIRIDGFTAKEVEQVIKWLPNAPTTGDGFCWRDNVLSGAKLRKQFDKLHVVYKKHNKTAQEELVDILSSING